MDRLAKVPHSLGVPRSAEFAAWMAESGTALLRLLPPETAHHIGLKLLSAGMFNWLPAPKRYLPVAGCRVELPGIGVLPHPIGLAAGFDKDAIAPDAFVRMGFAFVELGTVTPRPQAGNPRPRLFRYPEQRSIINRMGFNGEGVTAVAERLARRKWQPGWPPIGVNAGKNKVTPAAAAAADFAQVIAAVRDHAQYFVVNLSSPNTPGLRDLANPDFIEELSLTLGRDCQKTWIKFDPDLAKREFQEVITAAGKFGYQGIVLTNTQRVVEPQAGGRSGHPLAIASTRALEWAWEVHQGRLPMIGCGGILTGSDIYQKIIRGAAAVQIYTALVYRGPWVVQKLLVELQQEMQLRGLRTIQDAVGSYYSQ